MSHIALLAFCRAKANSNDDQTMSLRVSIIVLLLSSFLQASPALIPLPSTVAPKTGEDFTVQNSTVIIHDDRLQNEADLLASQLRIVTGFPVSTLSESSAAGVFPSEDYIRLEIDTVIAPEASGYHFESDQRGVTISGHDAAGVFYGTRTLIQLLPAEVMANSSQVASWIISGYSIADAPRFEWRGMHLDESRHFFGKVFAKRYIDLLASRKMNVFHWHLIDDGGWRIEIKKYPKLTTLGAFRKGTVSGWNVTGLEFPNSEADLATGDWYGGYYTQDDIREIVAYAQARHVRIIPEIEMPGHALPAIDSYPQLHCAGSLVDDGEGWTPSRQNSYCAGKEVTFEFIEDVLTEVFSLFPDEYVHIGGDEVIKAFWEQCPDCAARMAQEGLSNTSELQSYFIRRVETFINSQNRRLVGWDEITHGGLAPNVTVMFWIGTGALPATIAAGHDVVMTPMKPCYFDYGYPSNDSEKVYAWDPVPDEFLDTPAESQFLGSQGNVWTEWMETPSRVEYMILPRMLAMAEILWSPRDRRDFSDFSTRLNAYYPRLDIMGVNYRLPSPLPESTAYLFKSQTDVAFFPAPAGSQLRYTLDGSTPTESSAEYSGVITVTASLTIRARYFRAGEAGDVVNVDCVKYLAPADRLYEHGMDAKYVEGSWTSIPNFDSLSGIMSQVLEPDLSIKQRDDNFACQFTGFIKINDSGIHQFSLASDDGSMLRIGGAVVVDHDGAHAYSKKSGSVKLEPGIYPVEISFLEIAGAERLDVFMKTPGGLEQPLPANLLYRKKIVSSAGSQIAIEPGLNAEYAEGSWTQVPDFDVLTDIRKTKVEDFGVALSPSRRPFCLSIFRVYLDSSWWRYRV